MVSLICDSVLRLIALSLVKMENAKQILSTVLHGADGQNMAKFLRKGSLIEIEGRIETGSYQAQDGSMRYTTDVVCDSVQFLEPRSAAADRGNFGAQPSQDFGGGFGGGYGGTPSFQSQAPTSNPYGGNPFGGAPSPDQGFTNPSQSFNNEPDFSSTINISDDDLPF